MFFQREVITRNQENRKVLPFGSDSESHFLEFVLLRLYERGFVSLNTVSTFFCCLNHGSFSFALSRFGLSTEQIEVEALVSSSRLMYPVDCHRIALSKPF